MCRDNFLLGHCGTSVSDIWEFGINALLTFYSTVVCNNFSGYFAQRFFLGFLEVSGCCLF
jgi:hypothetical protein